MKLTDGEVSNMEETDTEFSMITETDEVIDLIKFMFPCFLILMGLLFRNVSSFRSVQ